MTCADQPDRQRVQRHRLVLLAVGVLVGEEKVLLVSGFQLKKGMMLHGSVMLNEEENMVLLWHFGCDLVLLGPFLLA